MRVSQQEKDRSHERIVDSAARLVRARGIESTSVSDVMASAGLTHGGFYRHFESKDALLVSALERAFDEMLAMLDGRPDSADASAAAVAFKRFYLSEPHVSAPEVGCPVAAIGAEVSRASDDVKAAFGAGVRRMVAALAHDGEGTKAQREARAMREFAMVVGAVVLARASDATTAAGVLRVCRGSLKDA